MRFFEKLYLINFFEVIERMANNLEVSLRRRMPIPSGYTQLSILELIVLINPQDIDCVINLARLYMLFNMDATSLESHILANASYALIE